MNGYYILQLALSKKQCFLKWSGDFRKLRCVNGPWPVLLHCSEHFTLTAIYSPI